MSIGSSKRRRKNKNDPVDVVATSMEMVSAFIMILNDFGIQVNYVRYGRDVKDHPVDIDFVAVSDKGAALVEEAGAVAQKRIKKRIKKMSENKRNLRGRREEKGESNIKMCFGSATLNGRGDLHG